MALVNEKPQGVYGSDRKVTLLNAMGNEDRIQRTSDGGHDEGVGPLGEARPTSIVARGGNGSLRNGTALKSFKSLHNSKSLSNNGTR